MNMPFVHDIIKAERGNCKLACNFRLKQQTHEHAPNKMSAHHPARSVAYHGNLRTWYNVNRHYTRAERSECASTP